MMDVSWGWQSAVYLFLGGTGAGTFVVAASLFLLDQVNHAGTVRRAFWASVACVSLGLALLLLDLSAPLKGLLVWNSFVNGSSWMARGVWGAVGAVAVFLASAVLSSSRLARKTLAARKALAALGIAFGLFVAVYTGMLLMRAEGVPLWGTPLLPCLFTASSLSSGVALIETISHVFSRQEVLLPRCSRLLAASSAALIASEAVFLAILLAPPLMAGSGDPFGQIAGSSARTLAFGEYSQLFWLVVVIVGMVMPLAVAVFHLKSRKPRTASLECIAALGTLVGSCELRFLIIAAGQHVDLVASALLNTI